MYQKSLITKFNVNVSITNITFVDSQHAYTNLKGYFVPINQF